MKKAGYPDAIAANIEDYKMAIKACDTGLKVWESWGEVTATFSCTFDQETTYKMPFEGAPEAKVVVTHNGPGKYSWVVKAAGAAEEWKIHACDDGMKLCARNLNTGDACTSELYKETLPIMGKWKTASVSGCKELYKLMGKYVFCKVPCPLNDVNNLLEFSLFILHLQQFSCNFQLSYLRS